MSNGAMVSVIIPTYQRSDTLKRAISSVLNQDYPKFEIIIVDDNGDSEHKYRDCIKKLQYELRSESKVRFVFPEHSVGGGVARNKGIEVAVGDYIAFLDDDDIFESSKLTKMMHRFEEVDASYTMNYCFVRDSSGRVKDYIVEGNALGLAFKYFCLANTSQWLIKRTALLQVGGFDDIPSKQDANLIIKLLADGNKIICTPEVLNVYDMSEKQRISTGKNFQVGFDLMRQRLAQLRPRLTDHEVRVAHFSIAARELRSIIFAKELVRVPSLVWELMNIDCIDFVKFAISGMKVSYIEQLE